MKALAPLILAAPLLLSPAAVSLTLAAESPPVVRVAAAGDEFAAKKEVYEKKAQQEYEDWRAKMAGLAAETQAKSAKLGDKARIQLDQAWSDARLRWSELEKSSAQGWDKARSAWEDASARMKRAWHAAVDE